MKDKKLDFFYLLLILKNLDLDLQMTLTSEEVLMGYKHEEAEIR